MRSTLASSRCLLTLALLAACTMPAPAGAEPPSLDVVTVAPAAPREQALNVTPEIATVRESFPTITPSVVIMSKASQKSLTTHPDSSVGASVTQAQADSASTTSTASTSTVDSAAIDSTASSTPLLSDSSTSSERANAAASPSPALVPASSSTSSAEPARDHTEALRPGGYYIGEDGVPHDANGNIIDESSGDGR